MKGLDYALWTVAGLAVGALLLTQAGVLGGPRIGDLRDQATPNAKAAPYVRWRDPSQVYAVVLHQMGFSRGNDPSRYLRTTAHYIILPDGGIYQLYDWGVRLPAANGFNSRSISVEFAGNFPSRSMSTDPNRWWYPAGRDGDPAYQQHLTIPQAESGRALMRALQKDGIRMVLAHRESSASRGNDPGPDLWGAVGEYAVRDLGMEQASKPVGSGQTIPQHWRDAYGLWNGNALAA